MLLLQKKNADTSKIKRALVLKGIFFETIFWNFQVSSVILTSFRRMGEFNNLFRILSNI